MNCSLRRPSITSCINNHPGYSQTTVTKAERAAESVQMEVLQPAKKVKADPEPHEERSGESNNAVTGTKLLEITPEFFKQET
jgi:hypothetical protein